MTKYTRRTLMRTAAATAGAAAVLSAAGVDSPFIFGSVHSVPRRFA